MALEVRYRKLEDLIPYARNSRTHSEEQVQQIASSIREFGFTNLEAGYFRVFCG